MVAPVQDAWRLTVCWVPGAKQLVWWALGALLALTVELQAVSQEARLRMEKVRGTGPLRGVEGVAWKGGGVKSQDEMHIHRDVSLNRHFGWIGT